MSNPQKAAPAPAPKAPEPSKEPVSGSTPPNELPSIEVSVPQEVPVVKIDAAPARDKMTTVVPRKTLTTVRIGPLNFSFRQGVKVSVPTEIVPYLREKDIV